MTFHIDVWRLPGPGGFVRDVARLAKGGQHVLSVLPRFIASNPRYSDALAAAIVAEVDAHRRIYPAVADGDLVPALGVAMTDAFDDAPVRLPALLAHDHVAGQVFVCNAADLEPKHAEQLPAFLRRLDDESRPIPIADRPTLVFLVSRDLLPSDPASVTTTRLWYWDRVSRWDVGALLTRDNANAFSGVLGEIRLETIIELAQWDLEFALRLASEWRGGQFELAAVLAREVADAPEEPSGRRSGLREPPAAIAEHWDEGIIDAWHGLMCIKHAAAGSSPNHLTRTVWRAQARALMPWLEVRRVAIEGMVAERLGRERLSAAVQDFATRFRDVDADPGIVELSTLSRIITARFGITETRLRDTTRRLAGARNKLAHLEPLADDVLKELVHTSAWLD